MLDECPELLVHSDGEELRDALRGLVQAAADTAEGMPAMARGAEETIALTPFSEMLREEQAVTRLRLMELKDEIRAGQERLVDEVRVTRVGIQRDIAGMDIAAGATTAIETVEARLRVRLPAVWPELSAGSRRALNTAEATWLRHRDTDYDPAPVAVAYWRAVEAEVLERVARPLRNAIRRRNPQAPSSGIVLELRDMGNLMHALRKARAGEALYAIVQQVVSIEWPAHATFLLTQLPDCIERGSRIRNPAAHGREVQWSQVSILREIVFGDGGEESIFADLPSARTPRIGGA